MNTSSSTDTRTGHWMQTYSGVRFFPDQAIPGDIRIVDIAHGLSNVCRFGGHCDRFYSVAEHSVLVANLVPPEHRLVALLHDATEAYLGDVPRPLKALLPDYRALERKLWAVIAQALHLPLEIPEEVHLADNQVLWAEKEVLLLDRPHAQWDERMRPQAPREKPVVFGFPPPTAREMFLRKFYSLKKEFHG